MTQEDELIYWMIGCEDYDNGYLISECPCTNEEAARAWRGGWRFACAAYINTVKGE